MSGTFNTTVQNTMEGILTSPQLQISKTGMHGIKNYKVAVKSLIILDKSISEMVLRLQENK